MLFWLVYFLRCRPGDYSVLLNWLCLLQLEAAHIGIDIDIGIDIGVRYAHERSWEGCRLRELRLWAKWKWLVYLKSTRFLLILLLILIFISVFICLVIGHTRLVVLLFVFVSPWVDFAGTEWHFWLSLIATLHTLPFESGVGVGGKWVLIPYNIVVAVNVHIVRLGSPTLDHSDGPGIVPCS